MPKIKQPPKAKPNLDIWISADDLARLKMEAEKEGLPYQTLAASVIHKFVRDTLRD